MNFKSQICTTREQSERLTALGLKKETADMVWHFTNSNLLAIQWELNPHPPVTKNNCRFNIDRLNVFGRKNADGTLMTGEEYFNEVWGKDIPAWSLHRLIELAYGNWTEDIAPVYLGNSYDMLIGRIEFQVKQGKFNKEYLED